MSKKYIVLLLILTLGITALFGGALLGMTGGHLMAPLDDPFILFQYAKQLANGRFFEFSPGDGYSTGTSSILFPLLLAPFFLIGFGGVKILLVSNAICSLSIFLSAMFLYLLCMRLTNRKVALTAALLFLFNGGIMWAYLCQMETGLFSMLIISTLYAYQRWEVERSPRRFTWLVVSLVLLSLVRPEGFLCAFVAIVFILAGLKTRERTAGRIAACCIPLVLMAAYLAVNVALTGHFSTATGRAKMIVSNPYYSIWDMMYKVSENIAGLVTGYYSGTYFTYFKKDFPVPAFPPFILPFFLIGIGPMVVREWRARATKISTIALLMFLAGMGVTVLLEDPAGHNHRYQAVYQPVLLGYAAIGFLTFAGIAGGSRRALFKALCYGMVLISIPSVFYWAYEYGDNSNDIFNQHRRVSWWVDDNVEPDARLGIDDAGVITYYTNRPVYDFLGLMTVGQLQHWRHGLGSNYERIERLTDEMRPDYLVVHDFLYGEQNFIGTEIYRTVLLESHIAFGPTFKVFKPDWSYLNSGNEMYEDHAFADDEGNEKEYVVVHRLDVADLESERMHEYRFWRDPEHVVERGWPPSVNVFQRWRYPGENGQEVWDGGRVVSGGEEFTVFVKPGKALKIVMRSDTPYPIALEVRVNGENAGVWRIDPRMPDVWSEYEYVIPAQLIETGEAHIMLSYPWNHMYPIFHRSFHYWFLQEKE